MPEFSGVIPAIITPFTKGGDLNEPAFRKIMEFNIKSGVDGFWVAGGSGESIFLEDDENTRLAELAVDQAAGRVPIIMHIGAPTTRRSVKMAERATRAGVDAICSVPPFFYGPNDDTIVEHYKAIGAAANLPMFLYNLPHCTGVDFSPALVRRVRDEVPQIIGLKNSGMTFEHTRDFSDMGLICFTAYSNLMLPALTIGAVGCIDGPLCVAPELWVGIWRAYIAGDHSRAIEAQRRAAEVANTIFEFGFLGALKAAVSERLQINFGDPRPPQLPLSVDQRAAMSERLRALGLFQS